MNAVGVGGCRAAARVLGVQQECNGGLNEARSARPFRKLRSCPRRERVYSPVSQISSLYSCPLTSTFLIL